MPVYLQSALLLAERACETGLNTDFDQVLCLAVYPNGFTRGSLGVLRIPNPVNQLQSTSGSLMMNLLQSLPNQLKISLKSAARGERGRPETGWPVAGRDRVKTAHHIHHHTRPLRSFQLSNSKLQVQ